MQIYLLKLFTAFSSTLLREFLTSLQPSHSFLFFCFLHQFPCLCPGCIRIVHDNQDFGKFISYCSKVKTYYGGQAPDTPIDRLLSSLFTLSGHPRQIASEAQSFRLCIIVQPQMGECFAIFIYFHTNDPL